MMCIIKSANSRNPMAMYLRVALLLVSVSSASSLLGYNDGKRRRHHPSRHWHSATSEQDAISSHLADQVPPDMEAFSKGYKTVFQELPFKLCTPSLGQVPSDLRGSYYRAGPAMFSAGSIVPPKKSIVQPKQPPVPDGEDPDRMVHHPFEGDGAVLGVTFSDEGSVIARFRFVRTAAFTNERKKGQRLYKSMDSTRDMGPLLASGLGNDYPIPLFRHHLQPGLNKNRKNTANTRAIYWGQRLFSLWDGGQPYKLDAMAISTEGRSQLGGAILREEDPFGSKMVYDARQNRALFHAVDQGPLKSKLKLYEFNANFRLVENGRTEWDLPGFAVLNDFAATENYAVFIQPNIAANGVQFMTSKEPGKTLSLKSGTAFLHLIPRPGSSRKRINISFESLGMADANVQFCNAYETNENTVVIDVIRATIDSGKDGLQSSRWPWADSLEQYRAMAMKKSLCRMTIDLQKESISNKVIFDTHGYFGVVNPAVSTMKHRFVYMAVGGLGASVAPPQGIAKVDCNTGEAQIWMPESCEFCGEPMYAPRKGENFVEDSGFILSVLFCGRRLESDLIILEASNIAKGPIARIPLGIAVPHGHFGCFTSSEEASWSPDAIERRAKLTDKLEAQGNAFNEIKSDFSGLGLRFDDMEEYFGDFFS